MRFVVTGAIAVCMLGGASAASARVEQATELRLNQGVMRLVVAASAESAPGERGSQASLSPKQLEEGRIWFANIVRGISAFSDGLRFPKTVKLNYVALETRPRADMLSHEIYLGLRFARRDQSGRVYAQHPNAMVPVAAHEFGHILFGLNVLDRFPEMVEVREGFVEFQKFAEKLTELTKRRETMSHASTNEINRQIVILERRLAEIDKMIGSLLERIGERTSHYNEFFADVVAVLYTEQPNSIADAIHFSMDVAPEPRHRMRIGIENRLFEKRGVAPRERNGAHDILHESRFMIWEDYLSRPLIMNTRKNAVLKAVVRAVTREVKWSLGQANLDPLRQHQLLNQRMIRALSEELNAGLSR